MQVDIEVRTRVRVTLGDDLHPQLYPPTLGRPRSGYFTWGVSNDRLSPFVAAAKGHLQGLLDQKGVDMLTAQVTIVLEQLPRRIR